MCYFLCVSTSQGFIADVRTHTAGLYVEDASNTPIGLATHGNRINGKSYLLTEGGCSCSIIGKGHTKRRYVAKHFSELIERLLKEAPSVSILLHTCRSSWVDEEVQVARKQIISLENFVSLFPNLEEDVRYVIPKAD